MIRFGEYELDFARRELRRAGAPIDVQPTPLRVLFHLAQHRDRTVSRQELFDEVWPGVVVGDDALTRALMEVRRAVGDDVDAQRVIRTLKGQGYRFVAETVDAGEDAVSAALARRTQLVRRVGFALGALCALGLAALGGLVGLRSPAAPMQPTRVPFGVAVLPIRNLSGNTADQELADGLTEEITQALSTYYPVPASTTVAQWRERAVDVRGLSKALGVSHVLEGSVRRDRARVRVTMQLVATDSGNHVWSETFEEPSGDPFAIQDRVSDRVTLGVLRSVHEELVEMSANPALAEVGNLEAQIVRAYVDDRWEVVIPIGERLLALLARAPRREPFVGEHGWTNVVLSDAWANLYALGAAPLSEAGPKFLSYASAAVAVAPGRGDTHSALARALIHSWDWQGAERELGEVRRACDLHPRDPWHCLSAEQVVCAALGCVERQLAAARSSHRDGPKHPSHFGWTLSWALVNNDLFEEAEAASLRAREMGGPTAALFLPAMQWGLGRRAEAVESQRETVAESDPEAAKEIARLGAISPEAAWRWIAEQRAAGRAGLVFPNMNDFLAATSYAELGDMAAAIAALERSVAKHEPGMEYYGLSPDFDPIRDTPRFRALIETMGLTAYHEKYGVFERARQRGAAKRAKAGP